MDDAQWQPAGHGRYVYLFWDATSREATAFCEGVAELPGVLRDVLRANDVLATMGAGDIGACAAKLPQQWHL